MNFWVLEAWGSVDPVGGTPSFWDTGAFWGSANGDAELELVNKTPGASGSANNASAVFADGTLVCAMSCVEGNARVEANATTAMA